MWGCKSFLTISLLIIPLAACGTYVPDIQEFWGTPEDTTLKVQAIAKQVKCELSDSINYVIYEDIRISKQLIERKLMALPRLPNGKPGAATRLTWLPDWGALITLTFNIVEKTSANPGATLTHIMPSVVTIFPGRPAVTSPQNFNFGFGGSLSSEATRVSKLSLFFQMGELIHPDLRAYLQTGVESNFAYYAAEHSNETSCLQPVTHGADLFVQSELKLKEWLTAAMLIQWTSVGDFSTVPQKIDKGVISHEAKFQIVSSGNVNPVWRLVRVTNATSSPLLNASRDRTQDLLITMGPVEGGRPREGGAGGGVAVAAGSTPTLSAAALNSHLASEIGLAVSAAVRSPQ